MDWPLLALAGGMITLYLTANVMAVKLVNIGGVTWSDSGTIVFPLVYMLGDVLTEHWGYRIAKRIIWLSFFCNILMIAATSIGLLLPVPDYQQAVAGAYRSIFGYVPRIVGASLTAFLIGGLANAWSMECLKRWTNGRRLWFRTIGSSVFGYLFDNLLFVLLAFAGTAPLRDLFSMLVVQFLLKMAMECLLATPLAYGVLYLIRHFIPERRLRLSRLR